MYILHMCIELTAENSLALPAVADTEIGVHMKIDILSTIATSIIAGALMNRKAQRNNNTLALPSFNGAITVKSAVTGRIRFNIPCLVSNSELCNHLSTQIARFSSVKKASINPTLGSVLLEYDENAIEAQLLQAAIIKLLGLEDTLEQSGKSLVAIKAKQTQDALNLAISNKTGGLLNFSTLIAAALIGLGIYKIRRDFCVLPNGFTMIRWGFNRLLGFGSD